MPKKSKSGYDVGYAKPPKQTQFKKGQSGNPSGKPKSKADLKAMFAKEFAQEIAIKENGEVKLMSKGELIVKAVTAEACRGKIGATKFIFANLPASEPVSSVKDFSWTEEHEELMKIIKDGAGKGAEDD